MPDRPEIPAPEPVVLLCDRCGNPFRANTIHTECGTCTHARERTEANERRRI